MRDVRDPGLPPHRPFLVCRGMGQLSRELGKSCSIPRFHPELFPPALDPTPTHTSSSRDPSLCKVLGQRGGQLPHCCPARG